MAKRKLSAIVPAIEPSDRVSKRKQTLLIEAVKPRNPVAINPLLGKSGAHGDKRKQSRLAYAKAAIRDGTGKDD
jgi:hypothetical protein